ncbi:MAG: cell division protein FtsA [Acidobacteriota bacterium]
MARKERIISCLDVGTGKICAVVGRPAAEGRLEVLGAGLAPADGFHKGVVVDMDEASSSIQRAVQEAEAGSDVAMDWLHAGISGDYIQGFNCHGAITIEGRNREVTARDMNQVLEAAQSIPLPPAREIIHVLPQEFFLDNRGEIRNPVGLTGSRLDVDVHVVTAESAQIQNLVNAINRGHMRVRKVILRQLASAEAVLTGDEKDLGCAVVDIGAATTDIAIILRNAVRFTSMVPVGGMHFTRDLAVGLRTPLEEAERIKLAAGTALLEGIAEDELIDVPGIGARGTRPMIRRFACEILHHRAVELMELVKGQLESSAAIEQLMAGVVLTGGGGSLSGIQELAERLLQVPVRPGPPLQSLGLTEDLHHPSHATAVGLALLGAQDTDRFPARAGRAGSTPWFVNRILSWVGS